MDRDLATELRTDMELNRAALYDIRQVNRTMVVAVNENVEVTRAVAAAITAMGAELHEIRVGQRMLGHDVHDMRLEIGEMKADIGEMRADLAEIKTEIRDMRRELREGFATVSADIRALTAAVLELVDELRGGRGPAPATT